MPFTAKARTERYVSSPIDDRSQEERQLRRAVAVVSIQKNDHIGILRIRKARQTGAAVPAKRFVEDAGSHFCCDLRSPVG